MTRITKFSLALAVATSSFLLAAAPASAGCLDLWTMGYDDWQKDKKTRTKFRFNELLVVCVKVKQDYHITIWDAPPKGDYERLFPNQITHPNNPQVKAGQIKAGETKCFGTKDTFPLYFPKEEGKGAGKLSVVATKSMDGQVPENDYAIPGQRVSQESMRQWTRNFSLGDQCKAEMTTYLEYSVSD